MEGKNGCVTVNVNCCGEGNGKAEPAVKLFTQKITLPANKEYLDIVIEGVKTTDVILATRADDIRTSVITICVSGARCYTDGIVRLYFNSVYNTVLDMIFNIVIFSNP